MHTSLEISFSPSSQVCSLTVDQETSLSLIDTHHTKELFQLIETNRASLQKWLPWVIYVKTISDLMQLIQFYQRKMTKFGAPTACIIHHGRIAGIIGYNYIETANQSGSLGYWLGSPHRKKGLMLKSCKRMINHGFYELNLHKVNILCATQNFPSQKIPKKLHFRKEGLLRDEEWLNDHYEDLFSFGITKGEWNFQNF